MQNIFLQSMPRYLHVAGLFQICLLPSAVSDRHTLAPQRLALLMLDTLACFSGVRTLTS